MVTLINSKGKAVGFRGEDFTYLVFNFNGLKNALTDYTNINVNQFKNQCEHDKTKSKLLKLMGRVKKYPAQINFKFCIDTRNFKVTSIEVYETTLPKWFLKLTIFFKLGYKEYKKIRFDIV